MKIQVEIGRRRLVIQAGGWSLIDMGLLTRARQPAAASYDAPGHDPHGTLAAQVEQAGEPAPGFGFRGSVTTVVARGRKD